MIDRLSNKCCRFVCAFVFLICFLPGLSRILSAQEIPGLEPVPEDWVEGRTLSYWSANFKVDAPSDRWKWYRSKSEIGPMTLELFACFNEEMNRVLMIHVLAVEATSITENFIGTFDPQLGAGFRVRDLQTSHSDLPVKGSYRFRYHALLPDGSQKVFHGYLVATGRIVTIQSVSDDEIQPPELLPLLSSFRLVRSIDIGSRFFTIYMFYGLVALIGFALFRYLNAFRGRTWINEWKATSICCGVVLLLDMVTSMNRFFVQSDPFIESKDILIHFAAGSISVAVCLAIGWFRKSKSNSSTSGDTSKLSTKMAE